MRNWQRTVRELLILNILMLYRLFSFTHEGVKQILGRTTTDGVYMFKVPTDSMAPTITQNDIVFIDTNVKRIYWRGRVFVQLKWRNLHKTPATPTDWGDYGIKRQPALSPFEITEDLFDTAKIIGKFIKAVELKPKDL